MVTAGPASEPKIPANPVRVSGISTVHFDDLRKVVWLEERRPEQRAGAEEKRTWVVHSRRGVRVSGGGNFS